MGIENDLYGLYIPPEAWHSDIPLSAKVLYGRLCTLDSFNIDGSRASREWMAKEIGVSKQRITQLIKTLISNSLIFHNGWYTNSNGNTTRLLKRSPIDQNIRRILDKIETNNKLLVGGQTNKKLLDPPNKKLLPNTRVKNNNKKPSLSSFTGNWRKTEYKEKFDFIHSRHPKIDVRYLRYALTYQEVKLQKYTSFFKSYSDSKLIKQIVSGCDTIDKLIRIDKHYFRETIIPALKWAKHDKFWADKTLSLANLRNENKEGVKKFDSIHKQWCRAEDIDPRKGRYILSSEVKITPMINPVWTAYLEAKKLDPNVKEPAYEQKRT